MPRCRRDERIISREIVLCCSIRLAVTDVDADMYRGLISACILSVVS
ncbi:hypothetical protein LQV63_02360 [Paenibacillus profundus]|uniref:Uncharacterized protein n=1 Tax=Paenibacillus profundus TaxID=1173085 RepID=A0ABS8YAH1_9BACL|nr:hypothetical protein [Paenibacillus profundus]